jgi:hypothetical protein
MTDASDDLRRGAEPGRGRSRTLALAAPLAAGLCYLGLWIGLIAGAIAGVRSLAHVLGAL